MNILILYGSLEGQTEKISEYMAHIIRNKGYEVTTQSGKQLPTEFSVDGFDAAIIGGSIHMGKYPKYIKKFVLTHRGWLNNIPSAFFTVCMGVNSVNVKSREEALHFGEELIAQTGWKPKLIHTFAGAVKYTKYDFITRFIMKLISKREGGSTDTSCDHEYTDWESVERVTDKFVNEIAVLEKELAKHVAYFKPRSHALSGNEATFFVACAARRTQATLKAVLLQGVCFY